MAESNKAVCAVDQPIVMTWLDKLPRELRDKIFNEAYGSMAAFQVNCTEGGWKLSDERGKICPLSDFAVNKQYFNEAVDAIMTHELRWFPRPGRFRLPPFLRTTVKSLSLLICVVENRTGSDSRSLEEPSALLALKHLRITLFIVASTNLEDAVAEEEDVHSTLQFMRSQLMSLRGLRSFCFDTEVYIEANSTLPWVKKLRGEVTDAGAEIQRIVTQPRQREQQ